MKKLKDYLPKIIDSLKKIDPYKIILFGSVAQGIEREYSDIDLVVILNEDIITKTYEEKLEKKVMVRDSILDISLEVPIDLLVYSKAEFKKMEEINKPFASEIKEKGSLLYERISS